MREDPLHDRRRDFHRLWVATAASQVGVRTMGVVYPLLGIAATGSAAVGGWVAFAWVAPAGLSYLPAGLLIDRRSPRSVILACQAGSIFTLTAVAAALILGLPLSLPVLLAVAAVEGTLASVQSLAETALLRAVVPDSRLTGAISRVETTNHVAVLGGRSLAGAVFGFAQVLPFVSNLLLRGVSAGMVLRIHGGTPARADRPKITDGIRALARTPLWRTVILVAVANIMAQALIILFLAHATENGLSPLVIGAVLAASGAGGVLGALIAPWVRRCVVPRTSIMVVYAWAWVALLFTAAAGGTAATFAAAMLLSGLTGAVGNVSMRSYTVRNVPRQSLAQVLSVMALVSFGAVSLGPVAGGLMAAGLGTEMAIWWLFVAMIPVALFVTAARVRGIGLR